MRIDDILYVEQSVDYDSKMSKLMAASGYTEKSENRCSDNVAMWGLETVNTRHIVSSIRLNNSEGENIVGFVEEVGDGTCKVKTISEAGVDDFGQSVDCEGLGEARHAFEEDVSVGEEAY